MTRTIIDNHPLSTQAQQLNQAITSISKLSGTEHTIILSISISSDSDKKSPSCNGFIKYGFKKLYFYKKDGSIIESNPLCLLDFYVDQSMQRHGIGLTLFQKMLEVLHSTIFLIQFITLFLKHLMSYIIIRIFFYIYNPSYQISYSLRTAFFLSI